MTMNKNRFFAIMLCLTLVFTTAAPCFRALADDPPLSVVFVYRAQNDTIITSDPVMVVKGEAAPEPDKPLVTNGKYKFIEWDKPITNVQDNMTTTAKYHDPLTIVFKDSQDNDREFKTVTIEKDGTLAAPSAPAHKGFEFSGWDPKYPSNSIMTESMTYTAQYKKVYTITFYWRDKKTVIATKTVNQGDALNDFPDAAEVNKKGYYEGYEFSKWSESKPLIPTADMDVYPLYDEVKDHTVTFYDAENIVQPKKVLKTESVKHHASSTPPTVADKHEGYKFVGWSRDDYQNVTEDNLEIFAKYNPMGTVTIQFRARINGQKTDTKIAPDESCAYNAAFTTIDKVNKDLSVAVSGRTYSFVRWETASVNKLKQVRPDEDSTSNTLTIYALYGEPTRNTVDLVNPDLAYSAKQGDQISIVLPISVIRDNANIYRSNKLASTSTMSGGFVYDYSESMELKNFDQTFVSNTTIESMRIKLLTKGMPFSTGSMSTANGNMLSTFLVQRYSDNPNYYKEQGFAENDSINRGLAAFALKINGSAKAKTYEVPFEVSWVDDEGDHTTTVYVKVKVSKKSSGSSGSGGGIGGTGEEKPLPDTRFYIDTVRTVPELPKAGEPFTIFLNLVNKNEKLYLHNLELEWEASDDSFMPAGEATNVIYIPKINANSTLEVEIPVVSEADIPNRLVKMTVNIDYQDKKMASANMTKTVTVKVEPMLRYTVDELKLPTTSTLEGEDYEIKVGFVNKGKTVISNLSARIISEDPNLIAGPVFHGGNVDPAASKTLDVSCTPLEAGTYNGVVEITFENESGEAMEPERREFSFTAQAESSFDDSYLYDDTEFTQPEPDPVTPLTIMGMLPLWLYGALGLLILLMIVSMAVSARKRRGRAIEDDEMD